MHRRQPAELARHVVRRRRHRAERRPAHDELGVAEAHEVGQVRVAAGKLRRPPARARRRGPAIAAGRQMLAQLGDERAPNRAARRPDRRACRPCHGAHRLSCAPCTSTTPTRSHDLQRRLAAFMDEHIYPNEATFHRQIADGDRWQPTADRRRAEAEGARRRAVEPVSARERVRRRADQPRVRAALRDHGPLAGLRAGGVQLLGARHRQHGSAGALRHARSSASSGSSRCSPARSARASR